MIISRDLERAKTVLDITQAAQYHHHRNYPSMGAALYAAWPQRELITTLATGQTIGHLLEAMARMCRRLQTEPSGEQLALARQQYEQFGRSTHLALLTPGEHDRGPYSGRSREEIAHLLSQRNPHRTMDTVVAVLDRQTLQAHVADVCPVHGIRAADIVATMAGDLNHSQFDPNAADPVDLLRLVSIELTELEDRYGL